MNDFCGQPAISNQTDRGTFLWKNCTGDQSWHLRSNGGGTPTQLIFRGTVAVAGGLTSLTPVSIEASDVLDTTTDPNQLAYQLRITTVGQDGFDFQVGADACFTPQPADQPVFLGSSRRTLGAITAVNLSTAQNCAP